MNKIIILTICVFTFFAVISNWSSPNVRADGFNKTAIILQPTFTYVDPQRGSIATYTFNKNTVGTTVFCQEQFQNGYAYCEWIFSNQYEPIYGWMDLRYIKVIN